MPAIFETAADLDAPSRAASDWLARFDAALQGGDGAAVAGLFAVECYWRDLVAFIWNIKTMEGCDEITAMLDARLAGIGPVGLAAERAGERGGRGDFCLDRVFETAVGRGTGLLRLRGGRCWTLLTTLAELKGFEEKRGPTREVGAAHRVEPGRRFRPFYSR